MTASKIDTLARRKAIDVLARELAELFGHVMWTEASDFTKKTWRAEARSVYLVMVKNAAA